jgi:hypothetical protein
VDTHRFVEKRGGPKIATLEKMVINWWIWGFSVEFSDSPKWVYNYTCPHLEFTLLKVALESAFNGSLPDEFSIETLRLFEVHVSFHVSVRHVIFLSSNTSKED